MKYLLLTTLLFLLTGCAILTAPIDYSQTKTLGRTGIDDYYDGRARTRAIERAYETGIYNYWGGLNEKR